MKYRKKPIIVEAFQYLGYETWIDPKIRAKTPKWITDARNSGVLYGDHSINGLHIKTLEGVMHVSVGDYIIRGINGEL